MSIAETTRQRRFALVGSPNSGKTTLFNALTGLRAKTGNYPGVTVARYEGSVHVGEGTAVVEDLPGTYSLDPISPDEQIVADTLDDGASERPDGLIVTLDATTLERSLGFVSHAVNVGLPVLVVLTFTDELRKRGGAVDVAALSENLGVDVVDVPAARRDSVEQLVARLDDVAEWPTPVVLPPTAPEKVVSWTSSVLAASAYREPSRDEFTRKVDSVLLHPVWGTVIFFTTMYLFFQLIFQGAAPFMDLIEEGFGALSQLASDALGDGLLSSFVADALIGGIGGVVVFLPQIILLFVCISLMEGVGYLSRAAFLMDKVMSSAGLEGRAFVALLSSLACAIPGIMATRSLPSARDRIATMMAAPLMTCSARLPVYVLLIAMLVPDASWGPFGLQGTVMFALYVGGAVAAMTTAWLFGRIAGRKTLALPFYMEMPPYRIPRVSTVLLRVWEAVKSFLKKVTTIILATTVILWLLLNLPMHSEQDMQNAGVNTADETAVAAYTLDHSAAAAVGRAVEPVFAPLGFDWRINVGVLASLSAREVFVATMGQLASAEDPEDPQSALADMRVRGGERDGQLLFTPGVVAALMVFFMAALQCMATVGVLRRESGTWKWPAIAFGYMFALAWVGGLIAKLVVDAAL